MSGNNLKYEIKVNEKFGRYAVASKDLKQGELIITELPLFTGLYWEADLCCLNCYRPSVTVCKECQMIPLCKLCKTHGNSTIECEFLKNSNVSKNFLFDNFNTATVLKCLLTLLNDDKTSYERLLEMEDHLESRVGTDIWKFIECRVVEPLLSSDIFKNFPFKIDSTLIHRICGIFDVNSFEIRDPMALEGFVSNGFNIRGIYPNSALLAHDCIANTLVSIDSEYIVRMYASVPIEKGEMIYFNYTRSLFNTADRRQFLKEGKYFECTCKRCLDPTECNTHLSSIKCKDCDNGLCIFNQENWICLDCEKMMNLNEVEKMIQDARNDIQEIGFDLRRLEQANQKYSKLLNPNHSFVIEIKQNIASILRDICVTSVKPPRSILKQKIELCSGLLPIVRTLQPGISRLTGITLYEIYVPLVQLAQRNHESKEIDSNELLCTLIEAESLLKESIKILLYEHASIPEGKLAKRLLGELKELRGTIEKFQEIVIIENNTKIGHQRFRTNKKRNVK